MFALPWNYLKSAFRHTSRRKTFSIVNLIGLALGLAAFSLCALTARVGFHYDAFHERAGRIYGLVLTLPSGDGNDQHLAVTPGPLAPAMTEEFPEVEAAVRFFPSSRQIVRFESKTFHEDRILYTDPGFLSFFSFVWKKGDKNTALTDPSAVVLTEKTAARYFGEAEAVGKRLIFADGRDRLVSGVIEDPPFDSSIRFEFLVPLASGPEVPLTSWRTNLVSTFILLQDGAHPAGLETKFQGLIASSMSGLSESPKRLYLLPLTGFFHRSPDIVSHLSWNSPSELYIALAFGIIFLLLVVFNYSSLAIAGCLDRVREVGIRKVVGSAGRQLFVQYLGESVLLAFTALVLSWPFFEILKSGYGRLFGAEAAAALSLWRSPSILLLSAGVTLLVGLVSGLYPAVLLAGVRPARILKGDLRSGRKGSRARKILMTVQFAIAIFLVLSSAAVRRQSDLLLEKDLGFDRSRLLVVPVGDESRPVIGPLREALLREPGIESVAGASFIPVKARARTRVLPEGATAGESRSMDAFSVDYDFLETMSIIPQAGRTFRREHSDAGADRWILNATAARELGWADPIGARLTVGGRTGTVIGVVGDFHFENLIFRIPPTVVLLEPDANRYLFIKHAASLTPEAARSAVEKAWEALAPHLPFEARPLDVVFSEYYGDIRNVSLMFGAIGSFTIVFSCIGMLGLVLFILNSRTKEIGIRKVLGASAPKILTRLLSEFIFLAAVADAIALVGACFLWPKVFASYAYSSKIPLAAYLLMSAASLAIVGFTILGKTWSAARANPINSLKYE
ncbi:MAG: ABC transporter permease [Candidatus Aminicenantes bacterium]|nr:ABC transporter permease [Candidatus Aminicenantes bacterium]